MARTVERWIRDRISVGRSAIINQRRLTVDRLAAAMRTVVDDPQLRDNAHRLSADIAAEDGGAQAVTAVESRLHHTT
ncbi:hypothetical protein ACQI4L_10165 [Mycolicibacterium litorale]|uniref:hypothetical protein n=1 Tax=Mycolicibacterium litorale TaxID=758802 RepID=UPI003CF7BBB6